MKRIRIVTFIFITLIVPVIFSGCAELLELLKQSQVQKPSVHFSDVRLTGLSFDKADLIFKVDIDNPNGMGIDLSGFTYDFFIDNNRFLNGDNTNPLTIQAKDKSTIDLPVSLGFKQLFDAYNSLKTADTVGYRLDMTMAFNLPVLGVTHIPVSKSGNLPNMKVPSIKLKALKLENLSFSGAKMLLQLNVKNPNGWAAKLNGMKYALNINGADWVTGVNTEALDFGAHQENTISIPFSLNFLEMGRSVFNLINGDGDLSYQLTGDLDLESSIPLVGDFDLPFNKKGEIELLK